MGFTFGSRLRVEVTREKWLAVHRRRPHPGDLSVEGAATGRSWRAFTALGAVDGRPGDCGGSLERVERRGG